MKLGGNDILLVGGTNSPRVKATYLSSSLILKLVTELYDRMIVKMIIIPVLPRADVHGGAL
jgi:hypothetical protein